jgi:hypothetical protein
MTQNDVEVLTEAVTAHGEQWEYITATYFAGQFTVV